MPSGGTLSMIYVGNFADQEAAAGTTGPYVDVGDVNGNAAEANAGQLIGQVFWGDTLAAVDVTVVARQDNAGNDTLFGTDDYDNGGAPFAGYGSTGTVADGYDYLGESIEYTLPDGTSYGDGNATAIADRGDGIAVDSITYYTADVTVVNPDGTETVQSKALVPTFQTDTGDIFIYEYANSNSAAFNFDGLNIKSIEFTGIYANNTAVGANYYSEQWDITGVEFTPCFTSGTLIDTDRGPVRIEDLKAGDMVRTMDHGMQELRWIGSRHLDADTLAAKPKMRPVRIPAGQLGHGLPETDLTVSRQHRMLVASKISARMFDVPEVLVPAIKLTKLDGIDVVEDATEVTYYHMMFDRHEVVFANGAPSESLYTGQYALESLLPAQLEEIYALFPELKNGNPISDFAKVVPETGKQLNNLMRRHAANKKPVLETYAAE